MKQIKAVNIFLVLIVVLLAVNIVSPLASITGNIAYSLDSSNPVCAFSNKGELKDIPIERCCYELQRQLSCQPISQDDFDYKCSMSEKSEYFYLINNKIAGYCNKGGYDVPLS